MAFKTGHAKLANVVEAILREWPDGQATRAEIYAAIPQRIKLRPGDLVIVPTRGEPRWMQTLRDVFAHKYDMQRFHLAGDYVRLGPRP
jgi:hypothetical protein